MCHVGQKNSKNPLKKRFSITKLKFSTRDCKRVGSRFKKINTESMIFYGLISTSLDKIIDNKNLYINDILDYIDTDLICYRAENPKELVELKKINGTQ